ncbi:hypothetical protein CF132_05235 [Aeromonas dhakensis]|nr:hypothetical protein CF132_05235 [Aeromonas dhakensis]
MAQLKATLITPDEIIQILSDGEVAAMLALGPLVGINANRQSMANAITRAIITEGDGFIDGSHAA